MGQGGTIAPAHLAIQARVAKLVDARDLKSLGRNTVPVQLRPRAPSLNIIKTISYLIYPITRDWQGFFEIRLAVSLGI